MSPSGESGSGVSVEVAEMCKCKLVVKSIRAGLHNQQRERRLRVHSAAVISRKRWESERVGFRGPTCSVSVC